MLTNPFNNKSYLVVDDFADMRSTVRSMLRSFGVTEVDQARDGEEAITLLAKTSYDVLLVDFNLGPGKDGQQILEEARHHDLIGIDSIFIMITAESTRDMVMGVVEYEPDSYLAKPFTKDLLRTRLTKLIERKKDLSPINDALRRKQYARAIELCDNHIAQRPKNLSDLLKLKADTCIVAGNYDEAEAIYNRVLSMREIAWARLGVGRVLFARKQYTKAREVFQSTIEQHKNLVVAYDWLAKTDMALNQPEQAEQDLREAVSLSPRVIRRQQFLGDVAWGNGSTEVAEQAFGSSVKLGRHSVFNHPSQYCGFAKSLSANHKHDEAQGVVERLERVFADDESGRAFYRAVARAEILNNQGDGAGAQEQVREAEQLLSASGTIFDSRMAMELAATESVLGNTEKAGELLHSVIANNHDDDVLLGEVARTIRSTGLDASPDATISRIRQDMVATNNRGVKLIRSGDLDAAIEQLQQVAEEFSGNRTIALNIAKALLMKMEKQGPEAEALELLRGHIERIRLIAPGDWRLAQIQARLQRLVSAR